MDSATISETENLLLLVQLNNSATSRTCDKDKDTDCKVIKNNCSDSETGTTDIVIKSSESKCGVMGVENSWNEEENFCTPIAADFPIPLPPPPSGFDDLSSSSCNVDDVEPGTLEVLFSNSEDHNQDNTFILNDENSGDVSDGNSVAGVCGLRNLGNTCFMSTGVQCLVATPSLIRCLRSKPLVDQDNSCYSESLTSQLAMLMNKMWSGNFSSVQPADFKHSLGTHYPQFKDYRQHDCQEFLALLLDGLHEQMNCATSKLSTLVSDNNSIDSSSDILDTSDSIKQKLDCGNSLQCTECWSPEKGIVDSNNYNYNYNNCKKVGKKELSDDTDSYFKMVPPSTLISQSPLQINVNKSSDSNECSGNNLFTVNKLSKKSSCEISTVPNSGNNGVVKHGEGSDVTSSSTNEYNQWFNNACLTDYHDIVKDAKTSNVNVLVTEQEINNEIRFGSEKYPKTENRLRRKETLNFNAFHIYENNTSNNNSNSGKRVKSTVTHYNRVSGFREGLDLKRIKMHRFDCDVLEKDKNQLMEYQNIQSRNIVVEKNLRKQRELDDELPGNVISSIDADAGACSRGYVVGSHTRNGKNHTDTSCDNEIIDSDDSNEGHTHWQKHLATNQSIIVDTFQGQFKSTVVCSACKYVSVTYEPFMYLSVPLPHAMERQICVTFISSDKSCNPIQYLITLNKHGKILELKELLSQLLRKKEIKHSSIILAEVFDNHVAKILNDNHLVRYVDDINRKIYAFELSSFMVTSASTDKVNEQANPVDGSSNAFSNENENKCDDNHMEIFNEQEDWIKNDMYSMDDDQQIIVNKTCTICLEEKDSNLQRHFGCNCVLCEGCIATSFQHYGGDSLMCPVCREKLNPSTDLVPVESRLPSFPVVRMLLVPIVYRIDLLGDGNNNKKTVKLFGHPNVIRLGNTISCQELYKVMSNVVSYALPYKILLVDGQGRHCSRCMFNAHCRGCPVNNCEGSLNLTTGDTLAITFTETVEEPVVEKHLSMSDLRSQNPLTLYDCIQAFSESEVLDKQNPWYCPKCQQNQCATKTLTVWRCPDYLIVYLKRFVFQDGVSTKLEDKVLFPFHGLNLMTSISCAVTYDLYACVCHVGGVSAGHYTAYTQHPKTKEWHYYNDDIVSTQMPQEEDYSNAYILFYKKNGLTADVSDGNINDGGEGCSSYNTM